MSEQDLGLKVASRRLLWKMGYTTRLDVQLRGVGPAKPNRQAKQSSNPDSFTDLDVLGLTTVGGFGLHSTIVDCKTSLKGSISRMFWISGIAGFFAADTAWMVREREVAEGARQLAARLRITALTSTDLTQLESLHPTELPLDEGPLAWLFDREKAATILAAFNGLDRKLKPLLDYREFDYWLYEEHRNPLQMVEHLRSSAKLLDPRNPRHLALVLDCAWLYLVTISHAVVAIRTAHIADPQRGLQEYLLGGPAGLKEKRELAHLLGSLREAGALPAQTHIDPLPVYFSPLLELTTRVMRRPDRVLPALRLLEVLTSVTALAQKLSAPQELKSIYDDLAAKQASDVISFLISTGGLDPGFRARARSLLFGETVSDASAL